MLSVRHLLSGVISASLIADCSAAVSQWRHHSLCQWHHFQARHCVPLCGITWYCEAITPISTKVFYANGTDTVYHWHNLHHCPRFLCVSDNNIGIFYSIGLNIYWRFVCQWHQTLPRYWTSAAQSSSKILGANGTSIHAVICASYSNYAKILCANDPKLCHLQIPVAWYNTKNLSWPF